MLRCAVLSEHCGRLHVTLYTVLHVLVAGKGHSVWRQPLKVSFLGEQGMDSGGVTREWFSALSSSISRGSPELFWAAGPQVRGHDS